MRVCHFSEDFFFTSLLLENSASIWSSQCFLPFFRRFFAISDKITIKININATAPTTIPITIKSFLAPEELFCELFFWVLAINFWGWVISSGSSICLQGFEGAPFVWPIIFECSSVKENQIEDYLNCFIRNTKIITKKWSVFTLSKFLSSYNILCYVDENNHFCPWHGNFKLSKS